MYLQQTTEEVLGIQIPKHCQDNNQDEYTSTNGTTYEKLITLAVFKTSLLISAL